MFVTQLILLCWNVCAEMDKISFVLILRTIYFNSWQVLLKA